MLVLPVSLFGSGTPPEGQSQALLHAETSRVTDGPTDTVTGTDQTSTGLPTADTPQGPEEADPFLLPANTAAGLAAGSWTTSQVQVRTGDIQKPARATAYNKQTPNTTLAPDVDELRAHAQLLQDFSYSASICPNCMTPAHSILQQSQSVVEQVLKVI